VSVRWSRCDPGEQRPQAACDPVRDAFEQHVAGYVSLGWSVVEREDNPLRARLTYRQRRRGKTPRPNVIRDDGMRVVWVDDTGKIQVERIGE